MFETFSKFNHYLYRQVFNLPKFWFAFNIWLVNIEEPSSITKRSVFLKFRNQTNITLKT